LAMRLHKWLSVRPNFMKTMLIVFCVLCAATAVGQVGMGAVSNQVNFLQMPEHPEHAAPHEMATEQSIVGGGAQTYTFAHGERPLWEFGPVSVEPSLGDVARAYRKEKLTAKKAEIVFEKQGS
jgi:hypothetical protein